MEKIPRFLNATSNSTGLNCSTHKKETYVDKHMLWLPWLEALPRRSSILPTESQVLNSRLCVPKTNTFFKLEYGKLISDTFRHILCELRKRKFASTRLFDMIFNKHDWLFNKHDELVLKLAIIFLIMSIKIFNNYQQCNNH